MMSIYFVDSKAGNDSNDGLSAEKAFSSLEKINTVKLKPGDKVLLKRDCTFVGQLNIRDSGEKYNPITVSAYGSGLKKPLIDVDETARHGVLVTGEYVEVSGLEITNKKGHSGIKIFSELHGATHGIAVRDCYIHDVGIENNLPPRHIGGGAWDHSSGGICVETNKEAPTWFEELRIENNVIENVNRTGIWMGGQWFNRFKNSFPWETNKAAGMHDPWYPHKNIYIGYNTVDHSHGDGIIGIGTVNLLMEHNKVFYANCMSRVGGANAALWSMCCDGAVIQYNEVAYTGLEYGGDGEAFDIDNCSTDTLIQYNYSHDNGGGFMLICNITCNSKESHHNHIIRNNLSVNDATKEDAAIFNFTGSTRDISILNNTIYTENENRYRLLVVEDYGQKGIAQDVLFGNNLICSKYTDNWNHFAANGNFVFDSNVFWNCPALPEKDNITDKNIYDVNPVLNGKWGTPGSRIETKAYIPCWNSPLLRLGKHFEDCAEKDYSGLETAGHNYIGAFYYKDANIG